MPEQLAAAAAAAVAGEDLAQLLAGVDGQVLAGERLEQRE